MKLERKIDMKKALVIVQSENVATKKFGEVITEFLLYRGLTAELIPISSFEPKYLNGADYLLLSGWKNKSLFSVKQPDEEWTIIFNKDTTIWGSFLYNEKDDALRIKVTPVEVPFHEWLSYGFDNLDGYSCTAYLRWEKLKVPFKISTTD